MQSMENIPTPGVAPTALALPSAAPDVAAILTHAREARARYEDAVTSDGVTESAWWSIASALHASAVDLATLVGNPETPLLTMGVVQCTADRAVDAEGRARLAHRMTAVAAQSRRPVIEVVDMTGGAS